MGNRSGTPRRGPDEQRSSGYQPCSRPRLFTHDLFELTRVVASRMSGHHRGDCGVVPPPTTVGLSSRPYLAYKVGVPIIVTIGGGREPFAMKMMLS